MIEDRLIGCPFCGGEVDIASVSVSACVRSIRGTFECKKCSAVIKLCTKFVGKPIDALEKAWNGRVTDER